MKNNTDITLNKVYLSLNKNIDELESLDTCNDFDVHNIIPVLKTVKSYLEMRTKEHIHIISKKDVQTLVKQIYEQRKIYSDDESLGLTFSLLRKKYVNYVFNRSISTDLIVDFSTQELEKHSLIGNLTLDIAFRVEFYDNEIDIEVNCHNTEFDFDFGDKIRRYKESTVEETTNAIIELIEEINDKQSLFKLVWSE